MKFLRFVVSRSGKARRRLFAAVGAGAVSGAASVALLALIHRTLEAEGDPAMTVALAFGGLVVLVSLVRWASVHFLAELGQGMVRDLRVELSSRVLDTELRRLEELGAPRLLAALTDDVNSMTQALAFVPLICVNGTVVVVGLAYLASLHLKLFLLLIAAVVLGVVSYWLPAAAGMARFRDAREHEDVLFGRFRALTEGIKELKLHRRRRHAFADLLIATADRMKALRAGAASIYGAAASWGHLLFFVVIGVLLFLRFDPFDADRATLTGYTVVLLYLMSPLQSLLNSLPLLGRANVAVDKVRSLGLELGAADRGETTSAYAVDGFSCLELRGIEHVYRREDSDHDFRLGPVDLELAPGEILFLLGGNGSGKTTLAKVLVGLYPPENGEIRLDGRRIDPGDRDAYRQLFSAVFGDFFLFEELLGLDQPRLDERARLYLEELELAHKVRVRAGDLSTTDLSQGQRKRLALLTAYLEDRPIYVFDEWASDQDPVFKEVFYRKILRDLARRGKAVVVVTHDDRYFHLADRALKLTDGKLESISVPLASAPAASSL